MSFITNALGLLLVGAVFAAVAAVIDVVYRLLFGEREAARAALERDYELRLIDAEALAKGLRAIDEAA